MTRKHRPRVRNSEIITTRHPEQPRHTVTWRRWTVICEACGLDENYYTWSSALALANAHASQYEKARP